MVSATGIGSMPGGGARDPEADNTRAYRDAVTIVVGELPDVIAVPELPGRGAVADMIGRTLGVLDALPADLQPFGWRLTSASGMDQRRARSLLAQDLDCVEELTQGFTGTLKTQLAGPWTMAALVEKPRGDKLLSDHGARRELSEAMTEGIIAHVADLRRRVPDAARLIVQIDEPALPAVMAAQIPTTSGWGKHRAVHPPEISAGLEPVLAAVTAQGAIPVVHCCAPNFPIDLVRAAGAQGVAVDLDLLDARGLDDLASAMDAGEQVLLGVVPNGATELDEARTTERVLRLLDLLGLEPGENLVLTPACGLAGMHAERAGRTLAHLTRCARNLS